MVAKVSNKQGASPKSFQNKLERHDRKTQIVADLIVIVICLAVLFLLDSVLDSSSMIFVVLKKTAVYAVVAVSMNLLNGFTGLFSLGQAGFMLIGAYTYGILMIPSGDRASVYQYFDGGIVKFSLQEVFAGIFGGNAGVGMFFGVLIALILAGVFAALFAFLIGLPVLRLKGDYLAIATLGFAEIIRALFQWNTIGGLTNGSNMLRKFPSFDSIVAGWAAGSPFVAAHIPFFSTLLPMIIAAICISLIVMLIHSSYGRSFKAIRDDEVAAEAMGINLALVVFSLIIMIIVLFYRRGIMGSRELNWDSVTAFFMKRRNADKEGGEKA